MVYPESIICITVWPNTWVYHLVRRILSHNVCEHGAEPIATALFSQQLHKEGLSGSLF